MHEVICRNFKLKSINMLNYFQKFAWILFIFWTRLNLSIACFSIALATALLISSALMPPFGLICLLASCPVNYWLFSSIKSLLSRVCSTKLSYLEREDFFCGIFCTLFCTIVLESTGFVYSTDSSVSLIFGSITWSDDIVFGLS
jgi:hypothetical protein